MTDYSQIGLAIRLERNARGIKQGWLAKQVDVTQSYLSLVEGGHRVPSWGLIQRIAKTLGTDALSMLLRLAEIPCQNPEPARNSEHGETP